MNGKYNLLRKHLSYAIVLQSGTLDLVNVPLKCSVLEQYQISCPSCVWQGLKLQALLVACKESNLLVCIVDFSIVQFCSQ